MEKKSAYHFLAVQVFSAVLQKSNFDVDTPNLDIEMMKMLTDNACIITGALLDSIETARDAINDE